MDGGFTQEDVDTDYGGDCKKHQADLKNGHRYALSWSDMAAYNTVLTGYEEEAQEQIEKYLGYVPHPTIFMPHEPYIRSELQRFHAGVIAEEAFDRNVQEHVRHIRNDDMKKDGWAEPVEYTAADYDAYDTVLVPYRDAARTRLAGLLEYEPDLRVSLGAEIYLRELLAMDSYASSWGLTAMDAKAMNIVRYRQVLFEYGVEGADQSILIFR